MCERTFFAPHSFDVTASEVGFNSLQKPLPLGYDYFSINSILRFNKRATVSNMFPYDDAPILFGQRCCNGFFPSIFFSLDVPFTITLLNVSFLLVGIYLYLGLHLSFTFRNSRLSAVAAM